MRKTLPTESDIIIAFLQGEIEHNQLTKLQQEKLERIQVCKSLLLQHKRPSKVVKMMENTYGYSLATAYRDLQLAGEVFGPLMKVHKELRRAIAEKFIEEDRALAKAKGDSRALPMCTRNYMELHNLKDDDADMPDWSAIEFHQNVIMVLPEQVGVNPRSEEEILEIANRLINSMAQDTTYTEKNG